MTARTGKRADDFFDPNAFAFDVCPFEHRDFASDTGHGLGTGFTHDDNSMVAIRFACVVYEFQNLSKHRCMCDDRGGWV